MATTTAFPPSKASSHSHTQPQTPTHQQTSSAFKAAIFQRLHPRVYLERFCAEDVRPDGRLLGAANEETEGGTGVGGESGIWRDVSINLGSITTADGSALVRMGGTTVVCGVKAEIAEPDLEKPNEGFFVPNVDLPAMCHPRFKPGPPSDEAQVLSERLFETLISSNFFSPNSLVIHPGKAVWTVYVDAICINYDGNAFDATLLAMTSALMNATLPKAIYDEDSGRTVCHRQQGSSLTVKGLPISTSFGIFDSSNRINILADPTAFEEPLLDSTITIITDEDSASEAQLLNVIQQGLGVGDPASDPVTAPESVADGILSACIRAAKSRRRELAKIVREAVEIGATRQMGAQDRETNE